MVFADCDGTHAARQSADVDRRVALRVRVVADLPEAVPAPALHAAGDGQRARMRRTRLYRHNPARQSRYVNRREPLIVERSVANLAGSVLTPAFDATSVHECASVVVAGCDGFDSGGQSADSDWDKTLRLSVVPKLAAVIRAPAFDGARRRQRARMTCPGRYRRDACGKPRNVDRRQPLIRRVIAELAVVVGAPALDTAHSDDRARVQASACKRLDTGLTGHENRRQSLRRRIVAKLRVRIIAPAIDRTSRDDRTCVAIPCGNGADATREADDVHRRKALRSQRSVPQLAVRVVAPALHPGCRRPRAGVSKTRSDADRPTRQSGDIDRCEPLGLCPVAELAVGVLAPAFDAATHQRTGVAGSTGNAGGTARESGHAHRGQSLGVRVVPQLPV